MPLLAYQESWAWLGQFLEPTLHRHALLDPVEATLGFQVFCVSLVILEFKRIALSDYLPALVLAPLLAWWAR